MYNENNKNGESLDNQSIDNLLLSLCKKNLPSKLQEELQLNYNDMKYNDMKFKLANEAIIIDSNECLDIILKSLKKEIKDAPEHFEQLFNSAKTANATRCLSTLNNYDYRAEGSLIGYWAKMLFYSQRTREEMINENHFKFEIIKQSTDKLSKS